MRKINVIRGSIRLELKEALGTLTRLPLWLSWTRGHLAMTRRILFALALVFLAMPTHAARQVALAIGNTDYQALTPLQTPGNDAGDVTRALSSLGFQSLPPALNLSRDAMLDNIESFANAAAGADVALLYYSGHAIQVDGANYLLPIDANPSSHFQLKGQSIQLNDILARLADSGAKSTIIILDACRDNPLGRLPGTAIRGISLTRGLAPIQSSAGFLVGYSTAAGEAALDLGPNGRNSPFTQAFLDELALGAGADLEVFLRKVAGRVANDSGSRQIPAIYGSLLEAVVLGGRLAEAPIRIETRQPEDGHLVASIRGPWSSGGIQTLDVDFRAAAPGISNQSRVTLRYGDVRQTLDESLEMYNTIRGVCRDPRDARLRLLFEIHTGGTVGGDIYSLGLDTTTDTFTMTRLSEATETAPSDAGLVKCAEGQASDLDVGLSAESGEVLDIVPCACRFELPKAMLRFNSFITAHGLEDAAYGPTPSERPEFMAGQPTALLSPIEIANDAMAEFESDMGRLLGSLQPTEDSDETSLRIETLSVSGAEVKIVNPPWGWGIGGFVAIRNRDAQPWRVAFVSGMSSRGVDTVEACKRTEDETRVLFQICEDRCYDNIDQEAIVELEPRSGTAKRIAKGSCAALEPADA